LIQAATFLAVGPQIYVDGLVVLQDDNNDKDDDNNNDARNRRLAGRIGGYSLARHILQKRQKWPQYRAAYIMDPLEAPLKDSDRVEQAFHIFAETRFAFLPVAVDGVVVASLSIRDLLVAAGNLDREVGSMASPLDTISKDASILDALQMMVNGGIRNLVSVERGVHHVINDRKVLEYLLGHESRSLVMRSGFGALAKVSLKTIGGVRGEKVDPRSSAGSVAPLLARLGTSCVFVGEDKILTPWDIVMKGTEFIS
jgi:CBS domain-containing protein